MNKIITIARQFGSGGRLIGRELAQKLNIPFLDNELGRVRRQRNGKECNGKRREAHAGRGR